MKCWKKYLNTENIYRRRSRLQPPRPSATPPSKGGDEKKRPKVVFIVICDTCFVLRDTTTVSEIYKLVCR